MPPRTSIYGLIKSGQLNVTKFSPLIHRFWAKVDKDGPTHPVLGTKCWIWTAVVSKSHGYGTIRNKIERTLAHRLSWEIHNGPIPEGMHVCHHCDNRVCVNVNHMFLGTISDNMADKVKKGRQARGEKQHCSVLTTNQVVEIRNRYEKGVIGCGYKLLAREFGVRSTTIMKIVKRRLWKHLP
jgi:hypothetical protein